MVVAELTREIEDGQVFAGLAWHAKPHQSVAEQLLVKRVQFDFQAVARLARFLDMARMICGASASTRLAC